ncbi:hypothetical protein AYO21_06005 [Fonsecaea monophora]|uniref:Transcription factor domain-containing protein n=1 Tax=Fonsecaea monophora TaxID=254056 RepID=A0A177F819_9EURO|nr:hypothetical protein AYO21_06005 [Fonsecaea monophora]OAG39730.1 hypothetical protein AYO21_06005 [Fonsecaea monophora]
MELTRSFSSYVWSTFLGGDVHYERRALTHKIKGMALVIEQLGQPQSSALESSIQAALILSAIEACAGNIEGFRIHISAARQMVKICGGLDNLSPLLIGQICSFEPGIHRAIGTETFPCTDRHFGTFLLNCRRDVATKHPAFNRISPIARQPIEEVQEFCDPLDLPPSLYFSACITEFLSVTKEFRELSIARSQFLADPSTESRSAYASARCRSVSDAFSSALQWILSPDYTPTESDRTKQKSTSAAVKQQNAMGLVCLFYIHATLWRYRHEPVETDGYMKSVVEKVQRNGLELSKSLDALSSLLVWICVSDENLKIEDKQVGWRGLTRLVSRLSRVALGLSRRNRRNLELALFEGLRGRTQPSMIEEVECVESPEPTTDDCICPDFEGIWKQLIE